MIEYKLVPVAFDEDVALTLAEREFYTEIDEQLADDIIRYARKLRTLYTAQQPAAPTRPECTSSKDAEIECLRAEVAEWKRVAVAQAELHFEAEERAERLAQAARGWMEQTLNMLDKAGRDEYEARFGQCKEEPNHDNQ